MYPNANAGPSSCNWGVLYGNSSAPMDMGTGGMTCNTHSGGSGGAAIFLQATSITINGVISVSGTVGTGGISGANATYEAGGGGSGGSIRIVTSILDPSTGQLIANGGAGGLPAFGGWTAGGGGGRISLSASTWQMASSSLTVTVLGGTSTKYDGTAHDYGGEGTVSFRGGSGPAFYLAPAAPQC